MRILLINHYAGSFRHGMEYRPYYLAREWVRQGHEVTILAASFSHLRSVSPEVPSAEAVEEIDGIKYTWLRTPAYRGNGVRRVLNMASFVRQLWTRARRIAEELRPELVIASSTYPMDIWPARRIAKLADASLVFEVHDLWPLTPMELGGMPSWHPFIRVVQWAEDYAYRHADTVISLLPNALDYMASRGLPRDRFFYIPNGIDPDEWKGESVLPEATAAALASIRERGRPIIGYAGGHGLSNALDLLLDTASHVRDIAEIVMVGDGPERPRLLRRTVDEKLVNVTMLPAIPKKAIPAFLASIDIAYMGMQPHPLYRFGISPNKLMDYMMAARPIVLAADAGNDPVTEAGCGITVKSSDPVAISAAIRSLAQLDQEARARIGEQGRRFVLENRTFSVLSRQFLDACRPRMPARGQE